MSLALSVPKEMIKHNLINLKPPTRDQLQKHSLQQDRSDGRVHHRERKKHTKQVQTAVFVPCTEREKKINTAAVSKVALTKLSVLGEMWLSIRLSSGDDSDRQLKQMDYVSCLIEVSWENRSEFPQLAPAHSYHDNINWPLSTQGTSVNVYNFHWTFHGYSSVVFFK